MTRYSAMGVHEYAVENEINSKTFWGGTPEQFETLAESAAAEIRAADPNAARGGPWPQQHLLRARHRRRLLGRVARPTPSRPTTATTTALRHARRPDHRGRDRAGLEAALASEQGARNLAYLGSWKTSRNGKVVDVRQIHFYEMHTSVPDLFAFLKATTPASTPIEAWEVGSFFKDTQSDSAVRARRWSRP